MMPKPRNKKVKRVESKLWIYNEGSQTEINYLNGYIQDKHSGNRLIEFVDIKDVRQNTPESLVKRIIKDKKDENHLSNDIHWVAYDREAVSKYSNLLHAQALVRAESNKINVALTNVCIEQWLLLHFSYSTTSYSSCDDLLRNSPLKKNLRQIGIDKYEKGNIDLYTKLKDNVSTARTRAIKLNKSIKETFSIGAKPYEMNPYCDFNLVLDAIDDFVS